MSIILKGIDLPKDCTECPLEGAEVDDDGFDYWYCKITESMATTIERPSNCPLIQIPKDHGRLIDGGELNKSVHTWNPAYTYGRSAFTRAIDNAPTILEAEE